MTPDQSLRLAHRFSDAITLLVIHGIISEGERNKARRRLDKWALKHGLSVERKADASLAKHDGGGE